MSQNQRFYDLVAEETAHKWYDNELMLPTIKEFISLLPPKSLVLDLGCGPGHESKRLASCGAEVIGLDYSAESIRIAREQNPDLLFYEMDMRILDESLPVFDGIFACGSLIHITYEEMGDVLLSLTRHMKSGGIFAAIVLYGNETKVVEHEINGEKLTRIMYRYDLDMLKRYFEEAGFEYLKKGYLDEVLLVGDFEWQNYIFKKN